MEIFYQVENRHFAGGFVYYDVLKIEAVSKKFRKLKGLDNTNMYLADANGRKYKGFFADFYTDEKLAWDCARCRTEKSILCNERELWNTRSVIRYKQLKDAIARLEGHLLKIDDHIKNI